MAFVMKDRARMTTATTGTGAITLGPAVANAAKGYFRTFAAAGVANGDTFNYVIEDGVAWEIGLGTYSASGTVMARSLLSSSTGALLNLTGAAEVYITALGDYLAGKLDRSGGTMSGPIELSADPASAMQPATKQYVDASRSVLIVRDEKPVNTAGGTPTANAWNTRVLNTVVKNTIAGASLASNRVTLPAGTYRVRGAAPAFQSDRHVLRLQNITTGATIAVGSSGFSVAVAGSATTTSSDFVDEITLTATSQLELQHYLVSAAGGANGLGTNTAAGSSIGVFAQLEVESLG